MGYYEEILEKQINIKKEKQEKCEHPEFDEIVYYKLCRKCGKHVPFRSPEDIKRRGEIGRAPIVEGAVEPDEPESEE